MRAPRLQLAGLVCLLASCLEYSPHEIPDREHERDLHAKGVERLRSAPEVAPLQFAVVGDTQLHFDDALRVVEHVNQRGGAAFVVQVGDFTHLGLASEFRLMNDVLRKLDVPYFVAVGVHDLLGSGKHVFESMFGPYDFAFTYARTRLVFVDTNAPEYGFDGTAPDLAWLAEQLAPSPEFDRAVVFAHIDPESTDFDALLVEGYFRALIDAGVSVAFHGHAHHFREYQRGAVRLFTAPEVGDGYLWVTEQPDGPFDVEVVRF